MKALDFVLFSLPSVVWNIAVCLELARILLIFLFPVMLGKWLIGFLAIILAFGLLL